MRRLARVTIGFVLVVLGVTARIAYGSDRCGRCGRSEEPAIVRQPFLVLAGIRPGAIGLDERITLARDSPFHGPVVPVVPVVPVGPDQDVVLDRLVATVNGDVITASDVRAERLLQLVPGAATMTDAALVDALVNRRLIVAEVARFAPAEPSADAVAAARRQWEAALPAGASASTLLARVGFTEERLTAWLRDDLRIGAYLDQRFAAAAQPTRDETQQYFQGHQADYATGGIVPPFADVQAQVRQRLASERRAALVRDWVQELRDRADIQIIGRHE